MADEKTSEEPAPSHAAGGGGPEQAAYRVEDRRHWLRADAADVDEATGFEPPRPGIVDEFRGRAEAAEQKLLEYSEAFKRHQAEQERFRERLTRDVDRRVTLQFGDLVAELLQAMDDLDLGLEHVRDVPEAAALAQGMTMARDRFLAALLKHGVEQIAPTGSPFDPNEAEAVRVDRVDSPDADQVVTETFSPGYRLGQRVIRAAKVAVGNYQGPIP